MVDTEHVLPLRLKALDVEARVFKGGIHGGLEEEKACLFASLQVGYCVPERGGLELVVDAVASARLRRVVPLVIHREAAPVDEPVVRIQTEWIPRDGSPIDHFLLKVSSEELERRRERGRRRRGR